MISLSSILVMGVAVVSGRPNPPSVAVRTALDVSFGWTSLLIY
jgi:hypothetical protein